MQCAGGWSAGRIISAVFVAVLLAGVGVAAGASGPRRAPRGLVVTGVTHNKVALNWKNYTRFSVRQYRVSRYNASGSLIDTRMTHSRKPHYVWRGLKPSRIYKFAVQAVASRRRFSRRSSRVRVGTRAAPRRLPVDLTQSPQPTVNKGIFPSHPLPVEELRLPVATVPGVPHHVCSVWDTDHTEVYPFGATNGDKHGTIRWEPGGRYAATRKTYMLLGHRVISGTPGRMTDGHNLPADEPYGWTPLTAPPPQGQANGVSPFAIDWFAGPGHRGYEAVVEPEIAWSGSGGSGNYHYRLFTEAEAEARRGQWIWLWVEIVWGRKDGSTTRPGSLRIWVAGEDAPRVNVPNINTHWYGQGMLTFWECSYWYGGTEHGMTQNSVVEVAGPRFGRTPQEAYNDNPRLHTQSPNPWQGDSGMGSWAARPAVEGNVPIPAGLRW
jgi:hypothetical protein